MPAGEPTAEETTTPATTEEFQNIALDRIILEKQIRTGAGVDGEGANGPSLKGDYLPQTDRLAAEDINVLISSIFMIALTKIRTPGSEGSAKVKFPRRMLDTK